MNPASKIALLLSIALLPSLAFANGGPQYYVDGYVVAMSQAPFVPDAGDKVSFLFSFVDGETFAPVQKRIDISLDISDELGNLILEDYRAQVDGGYHEFSYTFPEDGIYRLNLAFEVEGEETRLVHFLSGVKSTEGSFTRTNLLTSSGFTLLLGFLLGFVVLKLRKY